MRYSFSDISWLVTTISDGVATAGEAALITKTAELLQAGHRISDDSCCILPEQDGFRVCVGDQDFSTMFTDALECSRFGVRAWLEYLENNSK